MASGQARGSGKAKDRTSGASARANSKGNRESGGRSALDSVKGSSAATNGAGKRKKASRTKASKKRQKKSGLGRLDEGLVFVLSHQLRVRILAALNEEEGSAADLAVRLNCKTWNTWYHLKILSEHDYVEVARTQRVRSVEKTIYRAKIEINFPKEVWEQLPPSVQQLVVAAVFMTGFSDAEMALLSRTYEHRPESHASWSNLEVDQRGWLKLVRLLDRTLIDAGKIRDEAKGRLKTGEEALTASLNLSTFVLPVDIMSAEERIQNRRVRKQLKGKSSLRHVPEAVRGGKAKRGKKRKRKAN